MEVMTTLDYRPGITLLEREDGKTFMALDPYTNNISPFGDSSSSAYPSILDTYVSKTECDYYFQTIEALKNENAFLLNENASQKVNIDLLETQLKFVLNKLAGIEKLLENKNSN